MALPNREFLSPALRADTGAITGHSANSDALRLPMGNSCVFQPGSRALGGSDDRSHAHHCGRGPLSNEVPLWEQHVDYPVAGTPDRWTGAYKHRGHHQGHGATPSGGAEYELCLGARRGGDCYGKRNFCPKSSTVKRGILRLPRSFVVIPCLRRGGGLSAGRVGDLHPRSVPGRRSVRTQQFFFSPVDKLRGAPQSLSSSEELGVHTILPATKTGISGRHPGTPARGGTDHELFGAQIRVSVLG